MLQYKIVKGVGALKQVCKEATLDEGLLLVDKLEKTLFRENGIGLAANQIGIRKRVCILRVPQEENGITSVFGINLINPVITQLSEPIVFEGEGCLSFPGIRTKTLRYAKATVVDLLEPEGRDLEGLMAVCAQHEIDHTNGKTMYDSLFHMFKDDSLCPCMSQKHYGNCCKRKVKQYD